MSKYCWVVIIGLAAVLVSAAGEANAADHPGLQPGDQAPLFTLKNQNGKQIALAALLKKGPVALVFYRSADW